MQDDFTRTKLELPQYAEIKQWLFTGSTENLGLHPIGIIRIWVIAHYVREFKTQLAKNPQLKFTTRMILTKDKIALFITEQSTEKRMIKNWESIKEDFLKALTVLENAEFF